VLLDHIARETVKVTTRSTVLAFVAHTVTREAIKEPAKRIRKDLMKKRTTSRPRQIGHSGG
jgi:hypothetical protein